MPSIVEYVANYSANLHYGDLPADTVHLLKKNDYRQHRLRRGRLHR